MASFDELLNASTAQLIGFFEDFEFDPDDSPADRIDKVAERFEIPNTQLICSLGFNADTEVASEILRKLGFSSYGALINRRDYLFASDIYKRLPIAKIQDIYSSIKNNQPMVQSLWDVLITRLGHIEENIDGTISSRVIDSYKLEIRVIYSEGIGQIEFAEHRISDAENGFRALTNELTLIVDNKVLPAGDLFFRDSVLPEEKRKLLKKGLIPQDMIIMRLSEPGIPEKERKMLKEFI